MGVSAEVHDPSGPSGHLPSEAGEAIQALAEFRRLAAHSSSHGHLRLRDRRRGLGRQRAGQPAERGWHGARAACSRRARSDWHPYIHIPAGFIKTFHDPARELALQHGAQPMDRRPAHPRPARQDARRLQLHQRPRLQPRPAHGLRHLGAARQPRLGLCRRAPLFPAHGAAPRRGRPDLPRPRRHPHRHRPRLAPPPLRGLHRGRGQPRHPAQPRLQRHHPGGRRLRPAHHPQRPPGQRRHAPSCIRRRKRPNLTVRTHAHATELLLEGKRAVGVAICNGGRGGERCSVRARARGDPVGRHATTRRSSCSSPASARPRCSSRSASPCGTRWPASARTCATTTRRASSRASRTSTPSTSARAG